MQNTWLFDLDGTLTDSRPGIIACIEFALHEMNVARPAELDWCLGPPLHGSFAKLLATADEAVIARAVELYRVRFIEKGMFENKIYHGVPEMLERLRARGERIFVATSKPRVYAERIIAHFGLAGFFETVHGSELDGRNSNKAELIAMILKSEGLGTAGTRMVGDREHDMRGAKQNALSAVGVLWGYGARGELLASGADRLVESPAEL